jgi:hypothetical protein
LPFHAAIADFQSFIPGLDGTGSVFRKVVGEVMRKHKDRSSIAEAAQRREVQEDIRNYLTALASYPERFAREPGLSFEEHFFSISVGHCASAASAGQQS